MRYCAESTIDGVLFDHTYEADNLHHARRIATQNGWTFLGELVHEIEADEELFAQLEKSIYDPVIH